MSETLSLTRGKKLTLGAIAAALAVMVAFMLLPTDIRTLLVGKAVDHCPGRKVSCPSQPIGLLHLSLPLLLVIEYLEDSQ